MTDEWQPTLLLTGLVLFIAFRLYRRSRKMFGPQPFKPIRKSLRLALIFVVTTAFVGMSMVIGPVRLLAIPVGMGLAIYADSTTLWAQTDDGLTYEPNAMVSIAVLALIVGRIGARVARMTTEEVIEPFQSPWTTALLLGVFSYYLCYDGMILYRGLRLREIA